MKAALAIRTRPIGPAPPYRWPKLDGWQGSGVASRLMTTLMAGARDAGLRHLYSDVLDVNQRMLAFMRKHGMEAGTDEPPDRGVV